MANIAISVDDNDKCKGIIINVLSTFLKYNLHTWIVLTIIDKN